MPQRSTLTKGTSSNHSGNQQLERNRQRRRIRKRPAYASEGTYLHGSGSQAVTYQGANSS